MERWNNRTAVVTGASSGIGAAIVLDLVKAGLVVAGFARRTERVEELKAKLPENLRSKLHAVKCDVSNDESVAKAFDWVEKNLGGIDVLINSAGMANPGQVISMDMKDMEQVMQVNVFGVIRCTRRAFKSMKERSFDGHIININSILGKKVFDIPGLEAIWNILPSSKFALTALTEVLASEFASAKTKVKITSVNPGVVDTEFIQGPLRQALLNYMLKPQDISAAVVYALATPPGALVKDVTVEPLMA